MDLARIFHLGVDIGRICFAAPSIPVSSDDGLRGSLQRAYDTIRECQLDQKVGSEIDRWKSKTWAYSGDKTLEYNEREKIERDSSTWIEVLERDLASRPALDAVAPLTLAPDALMQSISKESSRFFDQAEWKSLPDIARSDLTDVARCLLVGAWTPATMVTLRGAECVLRAYYTYRTGQEGKGKGWRDILDELEKDPSMKKTMIGYLDYVRERRNEAEHPDKIYTQREAEQVFMETVNAIVSMCDEMPTAKE